MRSDGKTSITETAALSSINRTAEEQQQDDTAVDHFGDLRTAAGRRSNERRNTRKGVKAARMESDGECYLLALPTDVLRLLLARLPPRTLIALGATCRELRELLDGETIWRQSYVNRFLSGERKNIKALVQCCGLAERGWRREALAREAMIERWIGSKAPMAIHHPPVGLIHSLSLSYPPFVPTQAKPGLDKLTHRQKYEALLAASTRPAPYVLSAGLGVGGVVRSDPFSGKVSKGFWGPGRDANFHLRPHLDHLAPPSAVHLPERDQSCVVWGLLTGQVVHTTILSRHHSSQGGRALSRNVESESSDGHMGEIHDVYSDGESIVSAGEDGRVKLWRLDGSSLRCVWTSSVIHSPLEDRPDVVKLRQAQKPDPVVLARCEGDIVAGVTEDGDLRIWRGTNFLETRIDVGGIHHGGVKRLELAGEDVLIHHSRSPTFTRYGNSVTTFVTADGLPLTALKAFLKPAALVAPTPEAHSCGRVIVAGDEGGQLHMWSWDGGSDPIRSWQAVSGKVTSLDFSCGLVAVGSHDGYIAIYDPLPIPPTLLRLFHANHLSPADAAIAASQEFDALYFIVNQIILENDLVVARFGRKVFAWKTGTAKGRQSGKKEPRRSSGREKGTSRALDMRELHREADQEIPYTSHAPSRREVQEMAVMESLGLDGGDEALQYALMLSLETSPTPSTASDGEDEAIRAVEEYTRNEEREVREVMEMIRRAEREGSI